MLLGVVARCVPIPAVTSAHARSELVVSLRAIAGGLWNGLCRLDRSSLQDSTRNSLHDVSPSHSRLDKRHGVVEDLVGRAVGVNAIPTAEVRGGRRCFVTEFGCLGPSTVLGSGVERRTGGRATARKPQQRVSQCEESTRRRLSSP
jgi:hypothetical protein